MHTDVVTTDGKMWGAFIYYKRLFFCDINHKSSVCQTSGEVRANDIWAKQNKRCGGVVN